MHCASLHCTVLHCAVLYCTVIIVGTPDCLIKDNIYIRRRKLIKQILTALAKQWLMPEEMTINLELNYRGGTKEVLDSRPRLL